MRTASSTGTIKIFPSPMRPVFALFSIAVAAAELAVGLALVIAIYRHKGSIRIQDASRLKG